MLLDRLRGNPRDKDTASSPQAPNPILPDNAPQEFQVLLSACRVFLGTEEPTSLEARLVQGLDWDKLLVLANRHGVMPLLYRCIIQNCPQAVPQEWRRRLMLRYMQNAARNIKMTKELFWILDLFEAHGIHAIPFKGPALGMQAYGDITLRSCMDLDILVHKEDVLKAKEVLQREGYRPEILLNPRQEELFLRSECEYTLCNDLRQVRVEVHWKFIPSCFSISFDAEGVWSRVEETILDNRIISALCLDDLLIALCIHGIGHRWGWNQLKLITDIAQLINLNRDMNWKVILSYANEFHIEGILYLGLLLSNRLMRIRLPFEVEEEIGNNSAIQALVLNLIGNLNGNTGKSSRLIEEVHFWFCVRKRVHDRLSCIVRLSLEPTTVDLMQNPLPSGLYPLYYIIHPARLILQYMIDASK